MGANDHPSTHPADFDPSPVDVLQAAQSDPATAALASLPRAPVGPHADPASTGRIAGFSGGTPLVIPAGGDRAIVARSTIDLHGDHIGMEAVLIYDAGDVCRPIIVGLLRVPGATEEVRALAGHEPTSFEIVADGERLVVSARDQLVLRCGAASITLTAAGKVLIHGKYVSSRAEGVNRIKGGSVHLN